MVNFYQRFLNSIARTLRPLTDGLHGGRKRADKLEWSTAMDAAFAGAKQSLLTATHLAHPTSLGQPMWWQILSPGCMLRRKGLPRRRPVQKRPPGLRL
jgi:hypothetical protein